MEQALVNFAGLILFATMLAVVLTRLENELGPVIIRFKAWVKYQRLAKVRRVCTHTSLWFRENGAIEYRSWFIWLSELPEGGFARCFLCHKVAFDPNLPAETGRYWAMNPQAWRDAEQEYSRQLARNNRDRL